MNFHPPQIVSLRINASFVMNFKPNIGTADRALRILIAAVFVTLFYTGVLQGILGAIGLVVSLLLTASALLGCCPIYRLLRVSSVSSKNNKKRNPNPTQGDKRRFIRRQPRKGLL